MISVLRCMCCSVLPGLLWVLWAGQSIFVDLELWRARGSRGESLQQLSGEHSTISSSFSAPLPLAHVDSTSEAICQVLSPHPSYKLLLLSTTVSVHNSSGMPLEICFLDAELNPLLLPAAHGAYAPLEAIGEAPPCACKRGHLSMEEPSSLHPDLLRVPEWMLLREERWKLVQRRETLQHKEQLKLLQQASAAKSPSLRRTAAAPFRRSLTESGRITGYTKSPTSHGSLQHEKSARDGDLSSESHTRQPAERLTYTFLLPNQHVLSVPQRAILGSGWCNVCFRPAAFAEETAAATEAASTAGANPVGDPPECANSDAEVSRICYSLRCCVFRRLLFVSCFVLIVTAHGSAWAASSSRVKEVCVADNETEVCPLGVSVAFM